MLKIALCDDNKEEIKQYAELVKQCAEKHHMEMELSYFYSGETLLFHFCDVPHQVDIIYMDIIMNKIDGIETVRKLRSFGCQAQIIFLTSCDDYVYDAFDVNAVHYLLKEETSIEKFENVFLKAVKLTLKKEDELFTFEFGGKTSVIPVYQIAYFEIWKRIVTVHYDDGKTANFYASMEQLENKFSGKYFVRVHRSYLVNLSYIEMFHHQRLQLKTGEVIPVGGTYAQSLKRTFLDYISRFHIYNSECLDEKDE